MLPIKLEGIISIEHHESKYSVLTHLLNRWGGVKRSNISFFSISGHDAYQIKVKEVLTNMQAETLTLQTPLTPGIGLKVQIMKLCR